MGNDEITGEVHPSNIFKSGVDDLGGAIGIRVGEEVRWFDGLVSSTRLSEVVSSEYWWWLPREIISELKVIGMVPLTVMSDIDRGARGENGEDSGIIEANSICGVVLDLEAALARMFTGQPGG